MKQRGLRKKLVGSVISNKMDKTAVVLVERLTKHKTYGKYIRRRAKYMVHDSQNKCRIGDKVRIIENRPISKMKRWQLAEIINEVGGKA